jgi:hypothetical protein
MGRLQSVPNQTHCSPSMTGLLYRTPLPEESRAGKVAGEFGNRATTRNLPDGWSCQGAAVHLKSNALRRLRRSAWPLLESGDSRCGSYRASVVDSPRRYAGDMLEICWQGGDSSIRTLSTLSPSARPVSSPMHTKLRHGMDSRHRQHE